MTSRTYKFYSGTLPTLIQLQRGLHGDTGIRGAGDEERTELSGCWIVSDTPT